MRTPNDFYSHGCSAQLKPGDRVIWLRSPGRSFLTGWRVEAIPGVIVRVCKHRLRIRVRSGRSEKLFNVSPENVCAAEEIGNRVLQVNGRPIRR
jgi:hypothetical protein